MTDQIEFDLLPEVPPEPIFEGEMYVEVLLEQLVYFADEPKLKPDAEFLRSVKVWGVREAIVLQAAEDGFYILRDGRRRLQAAKTLNLPTIKVKVYAIDSLGGAALTLDSNAQRSSNPIAEYEAIVEFINEAKAKGRAVTESDIHLATGMPVETIRKRMKLAKLPPSIIDGVGEGKVAIGVAQGIVKLPPSYQNKLASKLAEKGKLTGEDVNNLRKVEVRETAQTINDAIFNTPAQHRHSLSYDKKNGLFTCECGKTITLDDAIAVLNRMA